MVVSDPNMKAAALWYAKNGIPVFPLHWPTAEGCSCGRNATAGSDDKVCRSIGKHPRTHTGFKEATTDVGQIAEWWEEWPAANIGIPTGAITKLLLVDLDPRNGGPATSNELAERFGPIPNTVEAITGSGGRHLFFRYPGGRVRKELTKGVDLKGDGGYFVAPPSLHASGRRYAFDDAKGGKDSFLNPVPAPKWLLEYIPAETTARVGGQNSASTTQIPADGKVRAGNRHAHLVSLAGTMQKRGMPQQAIEAALLIVNRDVCDPPKPEEQVRKITASVALYTPGNTTVCTPEGWPEIIPLDSHKTDAIPTNCLPEWLGEMALAVSESTETPFEMAALLALAAASSCVASRADVSPEHGYTEPLNLYVCPAMESGNRKTAVFNRIMAPIVDWERIEVERMEPERRRILSKRRTMEGRIEYLRKKAARDQDQAAMIREIQELEQQLPELLPLFRHFADDITSERVASLMELQGGRLAVFSDEGGIFDLLGGRYSKGIPNLDVWLKGHAVSLLRVDRQDKTKPPIIIDKPHLTVGLSPQPDVLASLRDKPGFRGRGLIARFLFGLPKSRLGYRSLAPVNLAQDIETRYRNGIHSLINYRPDPMLHLFFTPDAYREWKDFQRGLEPQFRDGGMLEEMRDWGSKLPGAAARIAGVLHMAKYAGRLDMPAEIERPIVKAALELAAALISHCAAVLALMERDVETHKGERVLAWIVCQRLPSFTARDCFRAHQRLFRRVQSMTPTLILLEQHGYLRVVRQSSSGGRTPSDLVEVNPALLGIAPV
jgi:hypothetical protein